MRKFKHSTAVTMLILLSSTVISTANAGLGNELKETTHNMSKNVTKVTHKEVKNVEHFVKKPHIKNPFKKK